MTAAKAKKELKKYADAERAKHALRFFKTDKGEYGEGDKFIGVTVPNTRKVAKQFQNLDQKETNKLIHSPIHEERLLGLIILVNQYKHASKLEDIKQQKDIYTYYTKQFDFINNWDLVDTSCHHIVGEYLLQTQADEAKLLYQWARSRHLWKKRIAIISTAAFIRNHDFKHTIKISEILINDTHDLIHKAVGWMLREVGKKDAKILLEFLDHFYITMPRTMLRYAIERLDDKLRQQYLKGMRTADR